jgi:hypothetical protein
MKNGTFPEISFLKQNLDAPGRGDAVRIVKEKLSMILAAKDWKKAEDFFFNYRQSFAGNDSVMNIVKSEFDKFVSNLMQIGQNFEPIMQLNRMEQLFWFDNLADANYKKGYIAEHMATFAQGVVQIMKLQDARNHYRKAQRLADAARIQKALSTKVKAFKWTPFSENLPPNPAAEKLAKNIERCVKDWGNLPNEKRLAFLASDCAGIRPSPFREEAIRTDSIFTSGVLEQLGVIRTIGLSEKDGRVDAGQMATSPEQIHNQTGEFILVSFLRAFAVPIKDWLLAKEGEGYIYQIVGGTLTGHLGWTNDSTDHFMEGLTAWIGGYPQVALSFWLPFFETALRNQLANLGDDIINPEAKPGIENFIMFEGLLTKATKHYDVSTVEYWRKIFSTSNGLGWNLRNAFCHGFLPMQVMKQNLYSLAVLLAYLFLLHSNTVKGEK